MAIKTALRPVARDFNLHLHSHGTKLKDVPRGEGIVFLIRHPIERFVSGFNSRLRQGLPLMKGLWTPEEERAFAIFSSPNELAEALPSRDEARTAMRDIQHVNEPLSDWFPSAEAVEARREDVIWIGLTETLASDFEQVKYLLSLPANVALPADEVAAHRTPQGYSTGLSERGHRNIANWYRDDINLFHAVKDLREKWFGGS